jgi:hypothetical protein
MSKSYRINTTKDILEAVTTENIDGFLKDFELWLRMTVELKKQSEGIAFVDLVNSLFVWNDDGDFGKFKSVKIEFISEENAQK